MFWPFRRSKGWQKVKAREGFIVEMPARPRCKHQKVDTKDGPMQLTIYNAIADGGLSCQVTVREGLAVEGLSDHELVEGWKSEFAYAMSVNGLDVKSGGEAPLPGGTPGRDLTYLWTGGTLTRVRLVRDTTRLIALVAIGPADRIHADGERFLASFCLDSF